jgi:K+-transporting ATPase ATPase A chain
MTAGELLTLLGIGLLLLVACPLLARYLDAVFGGGPAPGDRVFAPVERALYRVLGTGPERRQGWRAYAASVLAFGTLSVLALYVILRAQDHLPFNPYGVPGMSPGLAFNTAVSFVTGTNWQAYSGESAASHLSQMAGLVVGQFTAAAVGIAVGVAVLRGVTRRTDSIGNFWVDVTRAITRVLLPLSALAALVLVSQGAIQNLRGATRAVTLEGAAQSIPGGPAATMAAIKALGTNGGGFFGVGTAHPFDNPNGMTNAFQLVLCLVIPFAFAVLYGRWSGDRRHGRVVVAVMAVLWIVPIVIGVYAEGGGNSALETRGVDQSQSVDQRGGNEFGKDIRLGAGGSTITAVGSMGTTTGLGTSAIGSFTPGGQISNLSPILLGEISPGGVGTGMVGMVANLLLAVFIGGLMVGRTPELLGKSVGRAEMKLVVLATLAVPAVVLAVTGASVVVTSAARATSEGGSQGFTEILYAAASATNGNGSAMAGLRASAPWYLDVLGLAMLAGRYLTIIPVLALGARMGDTVVRPTTSATLPTTTPTFTALLGGVVVTVGGLTFLPALALGPVYSMLR